MGMHIVRESASVYAGKFGELQVSALRWILCKEQSQPLPHLLSLKVEGGVMLLEVSLA